MAALPTFLLWVSIAATGDTTLVEFTAPGCQHCRVMDATVRRLQAAGYAVQRVDATQHREVAAKYGVSGTPTYVLMVNGQPVQKIEGASSYDRLVQVIESASPPAASGPAVAPPSTTPPSTTPPSTTPPSTTPPSATPPSATPPSVTPPSAAISRPAVEARPVSHSIAPPREPLRLAPGETVEQFALQATVRIRIADESGTSVATGTIIEVHGEDALILTCGHVFRASRGKGDIQVDLFVPGAGAPLKGELIDFDFYRDIGLVSIRPSLPVRSAPIAAPDQRLDVQTTVFSVGCDNGGQPRVERSRITRLNRYTGPPNVEVSGAPTGGRSGGGLFAADGSLIGVCNAANEAENEGIYASLPTIHWQLNQVGLQRLIPAPQQPVTAIAAAAPATRSLNAASPVVPTGNSVPTGFDGPIAGAAPTAPLAAGDDDQELFVVIRSKSRPQDPGRAFVIDRPHAGFVEQIHRTGRPATVNAPTTPSDPNDSIAGSAPAEPSRSRPPLPEAKAPVLRGQQPGGIWPFNK